jgi:branched-subunit amino acid aminotransferase/4-amino-4-deoxychorismate lyase
MAFLNGRMVPDAEAVLHASDAGVVFGATVSDFCRTYARRLFRFRDHLARFRRGCEECFIPVLQDDATLTAAAEALVADVRGEAALVMFATPGPLPSHGGSGPPTLILHAFPLDLSRYAPFFRSGVHLATLASPVPGALAPPWVKHRSRLHWWRASRLTDVGLPLLVTPEGTVLETAIGNVLLVEGERLVAAPPSMVLDGVSQRVTREASGMPWSERAFTIEDCLAADEALLCGTAFGIAPVSRIGDRDRPWGGPAYRRLLAAWAAETGLDIERQFLEVAVDGPSGPKARGA